MSIVISLRLILAGVLTTLTVVLFFATNSEGAAPSLKTEECLECHEAFKGTVHSNVSCTECHSTITSLPHPDKLVKPSCASCHKEAVEAFDRSAHKRKGVECSQCHTTHNLNKGRKYCVSCHGAVSHPSLPSAAKHLSSLTCAACHGDPKKMSLTVHLDLKQSRGVKQPQIDSNGDRFVSKEEWDALDDLLKTTYRGAYGLKHVVRVESDEHGINKTPAPCSTCHTGQGQFSSAALQVGGSSPFTLPIDPTVFVPELPSVKEFSRTVHGRKGVTCSQCHLSQNRFAEGWSENSMVCVKCHKDVEGVYAKSVHSKIGATHCVDCHNPHKTKSYKELTANERVAVCSRCHRDYLRKHAWLPNTTLHFAYLECATCHSPQSEKSMIYYFAVNDGGKKIPMTYSQIVSLYGSDPLHQITQGPADSLADERIGRVFARLHDLDGRVLIDASILVTRVHHDYSEKRLKEKDCVACHSGEAAFYQSIFFVVPGENNSNYIPVKGGLFSSYPLGGLVDFFLLGEDKIRKNDFSTLIGAVLGKEKQRDAVLGFKIIDFAALFLVLATLFGIAVHVVLRLVVRR